MKSKQVEELKIADEKIIAFTQIKRLNKVVDKLEQRISKLEKVLESHAKCIGEMREGESKDAFINLMEKGEKND